MGYTPLPHIADDSALPIERALPQRWVLHSVLFVLTFLSCVLAGAVWNGSGVDLAEMSTWTSGLTYGVLIMSFISAHEFGHFFAAKYHNVDATLPFYIPMPFFSVMPFGTMGAVIRTRSPIRSRKILFDIGVAGPLAGFVVALVILIIGFITLPDINYLYRIHPEYQTMFNGQVPDFGLTFGDSLLFRGLAMLFANPHGFLPPMNEVYHYPFLCVGWFGLFVTSLNMLPIGQLDGGHVAYAMFGRGQSTVARLVIAILLAVGFMGAVGGLRPLLFEDTPDTIAQAIQAVLQPPVSWLESTIPWIFDGWIGWLMWALLARFLFRLDHPPVEDEEELDPMRRRIGWLALAIFVVSISLSGIYEKDVDRNSDGTPQVKTYVHYHAPKAAPTAYLSHTLASMPFSSQAEQCSPTGKRAL